MLNLPFGGVSSRPMTCLNSPLLAIWWPADWLTPLYPSQLKAKTLMPSFSFISRATACTSSPIRPTGQVEKTAIALG